MTFYKIPTLWKLFYNTYPYSDIHTNTHAHTRRTKYIHTYKHTQTQTQTKKHIYMNTYMIFKSLTHTKRPFKDKTLNAKPIFNLNNIPTINDIFTSEAMLGPCLVVYLLIGSLVFTFKVHLLYDFTSLRKRLSHNTMVCLAYRYYYLETWTYLMQGNIVQNGLTQLTLVLMNPYLMNLILTIFPCLVVIVNYSKMGYINKKYREEYSSYKFCCCMP